jgi:hypothetical protein
VLSAGVVHLVVDSGCLQMAGDKRGCLRVGRSCRPLLKLQAPAVTSECVVGLDISPWQANIVVVDEGISAIIPWSLWGASKLSSNLL